MERWSRTEILSLILQSAEQGATRTILMYETYLSHGTLEGYLSSLLEAGLLEYLIGAMKFRTTAAGLKYLSNLTGAIGCTHQCKKCGILYRCDYARCYYPFQHGNCLRCAKVIGCEIMTNELGMLLPVQELAR